MMNDYQRAGPCTISFPRPVISVCKAWWLLSKKAGLHHLSCAIARYMWYNESQALSYNQSLPMDPGPWNRRQHCVKWVIHLSGGRCWYRIILTASTTDNPLSHLTYLMLDRLYFLILNYELIRRGCPMVRAGKISDSLWRTSAYLLFYPVVRCDSDRNRASNACSSQHSCTWLSGSANACPSVTKSPRPSAVYIKLFWITSERVQQERHCKRYTPDWKARRNKCHYLKVNWR